MILQKNWLVSVDLIQTDFIPGQCKQTQPNFCLSTQTDRASSWTGLSKSHCSKQARWQSHPIAMASSVCLCPTASPVQHSHKWHGRGSPWSSSLHAPSHPNQCFATREGILILAVKCSNLNQHLFSNSYNKFGSSVWN